MGEAADKLLKLFFCMRYHGCVVGEEHLTDEYLCDFGLGAEMGNVKEPTIRSCVKKDPLPAVRKGILKEHGKEDAEECWCQYTALFHSTADLKGL